MYKIYRFLILVLIGLDQLTKHLALNGLKGITTYPIIEGFFHLTYVENYGAAFGMLKGHGIVFVVMAVLAYGVGMHFLKEGKRGRIFDASLILIVSGAIGNAIDRIFHGYVIDFLDFNGIWKFIFNVADIYVVVGTILLVIYILFVEGRAQKNVQ